MDPVLAQKCIAKNFGHAGWHRQIHDWETEADEKGYTHLRFVQEKMQRHWFEHMQEERMGLFRAKCSNAHVGTLEQMQDAVVKNTSSFKKEALSGTKSGTMKYESYPSTDVYCQKTSVTLFNS